VPALLTGSCCCRPLELERAIDCLRSAEILAAAAQHGDAISRAYYADFHAACA